MEVLGGVGIDRTPTGGVSGHAYRARIIETRGLELGASCPGVPDGPITPDRVGPRRLLVFARERYRGGIHLRVCDRTAMPPERYQI